MISFNTLLLKPWYIDLTLMLNINVNVKSIVIVYLKTSHSNNI